MFSCYSGCRQYRENIIEARKEVGDDAPVIEKVRFGFNHPGFIGSMRDRVQESIDKFDDLPADKIKLMFTAHSIPNSMSENCDYEKQLRESCRLIADGMGVAGWQLVYQSRSGPPQQPWLEPDVCDSIQAQHDQGKLQGVVVIPVGFVSDHMEVMYDLDEEAADLCKNLGIPMQRAGTAGTHPDFVAMIRELVVERMQLSSDRPALGELGPWHDICPSNCCLYTPAKRPTARV
jgi:ferrochelatase